MIFKPYYTYKKKDIFDWVEWDYELYLNEQYFK